MGHNPEWPFLPHTTQHNKVIVDNPIVILYFPLCGGEFLSKVLSCSEEFFGEKYFDYLENYYSFSPQDWLKTYEDGHHEVFFPAHARYLTFSEWMKFDRIIYINYKATKKETDYLLFRRKFIKNSVESNKHADLQLKYEKELINHFNTNNKNYYEFALTSILNENEFVAQINDCTNYFNLTNLNEKKLRNLYQTYMKLNFKKSTYTEKKENW